MSDSNSSVKTTIIVAVIGLLGTLATVIINNWDKIFKPNTTQYEIPKDNTNKKILSGKNLEESISSVPVNSTIDYKIIAESMVSDFLAALKSRDVNALVAMSSTPFYNDHDILISLTDVRDRFEKNFAAKNSNEFPLIKSIKVKTVAEWKNEGLIKENDRIMSNLNIPDGSYLGVAAFEHDALVIVFRKQGNDLKVAGIWD
jgi:predicted AAA+ superfamily ATPase